MSKSLENEVMKPLNWAFKDPGVRRVMDSKDADC